eukprot:CAMPEP_0194327428 /NCGR_PEP_ID=MMETSP0171-20130528/41007_1 /TAXON_ID=218684 /ORGANISM="Corethron pennatum, Strain L29A3" /LENGTH=263 /DNA_ID=CAMNT_0039087377 /DNA_START=94 /DNA_END=886 /DNA_ORIENTATION=-
MIRNPVPAQIGVPTQKDLAPLRPLSGPLAIPSDEEISEGEVDLVNDDAIGADDGTLSEVGAGDKEGYRIVPSVVGSRVVSVGAKLEVGSNVGKVVSKAGANVGSEDSVGTKEEEGCADGASDRDSDGAPDGGTEGVTDGRSEGAAEGAPEGIPDGAAEGVRDVEGDPDGRPDGGAEGDSDGVPEGGAEGAAEGIPDGAAEGVWDAEGDPVGLPEGGAEGAAEGDPVGASEGPAVTVTVGAGETDGAAVGGSEHSRPQVSGQAS